MATWTNETKQILGNNFLLLETGDYLLQEDGASRIILQSSGTWSNVSK